MDKIGLGVGIAGIIVTLMSMMGGDSQKTFSVGDITVKGNVEINITYTVESVDKLKNEILKPIEENK